jgi:hypothetical protein
MTCGCSACAQQSDPLKLVRTGTTQVQRSLAALDVAGLKVDERRPEDAMVFASAYARHLPFVDGDGAPDGTWEEFFTADSSAQLAAAATQDVSVYRTTVQELLHRLQDPELPASGPDMIEALGAVFDCVGTLALQLDTLKQGLPEAEPLRATLSNLVRSRLSAVLRQLIGFYLAGDALGVVDRTAPPSAVVLILGRGIVSFDSLLTGPGLSPDWPQGVGLAGWGSYISVNLTEPTGAYGTGPADVDKVNHLATHNLFTAACEAFLAGYARVVEDAGAALRASFAQGSHEPHYALFLAFLRLLDHARDEMNTLSRKHLDFYYRRVLHLAERPARPSQAHVLVELAKHVDVHLVPEGTLLKAGRDLHFAVDRDLVANQAVVAELRSLYRHRNSSAAETLPFTDGRIFATPTANEGESWHPFAKKTYADGTLQSIDMPPAEVGFAVASHHLWLAEGSRYIKLQVGPAAPTGKGQKASEPALLRCRLTTAEGWLEKGVDRVATGRGGIAITLRVDPNDPPITPYDPAVHGYAFDTTQPVLLVTLRDPDDAPWSYPLLSGTRVSSLTLTTWVDGIRTLSLANDQGPIDASKPFLAFGSTPTSNSSLVIGSKEAFQKAPKRTWLSAILMATPVPHGDAPTLSFDYLDGGTWRALGAEQPTSLRFLYFQPFSQPPITTPDLTPNAAYSTTSRSGFIRLKVDRGYGTDTYPVDLAAWVAHGSKDPAPTAPVLPLFSSLTLGYTAVQEVNLAAPSEATGRFFHVTPFGLAEQHAANGPLLPAFLAGPNDPAAGELYLGVQGLSPPQNLALLFQVADGTANPLAAKPENHLRWSYLRGNEWAAFPADAVSDLTEELLVSGVVTLAVPADATTRHSLMPPGMHWIRIAVASATDAVCRLAGVAAQALRATSRVPEGAATLTVDLAAGTISKLDSPDAAVKKVSQPYPTFGGRPVEDSTAFATRVSERLRHKDRAITLWDHEHLLLEAFPGIYQARCLNHTLYDPTTCGAGSYHELAPGHVTVVTIPDLAVPNPRDPLRPYTSLDVLGEIERFLRARMSCFAQLHVRNPQFEEVRVALRVRLRDGADETFHVNRLKREITEFLSPWAYRAEAHPEFNGKIHKSVLVNFIEERPYVDYVSDVQLFRKLPDATTEELFSETVVGSRAISILVSAPAAHHKVDPIPAQAAALAEDCACTPEVVS